MNRTKRAYGSALIAAMAFAAFLPLKTQAANFAIDRVKRQAESDVKGLLDPLVNKYCVDQCKLLSVDAEVEMFVPEEIAPGFDELASPQSNELVPAAVRVKMLMDDMLGPVTRGKFLDLMQRHLDGLDYPVTIETKLAHFPKPASSARKVAQIREKLTRRFRTTINKLFEKFCPETCMMADFELQVDPVNLEEAQYGSSSEYFHEGDTAVRVRNVSATILMDNTLPPEARANIIEMARLKTNFLENVELTARSMHFPKPGMLAGGSGYRAGGVTGGTGFNRSLASTKKADTTTTTTNSAQNTENVNTTTTANRSEQNLRQEKYERIEKIERVEDGSAVQAQLKKMGIYALIFACAVLSLLIFILLSSYKPRARGESQPTVSRIIQNLTSDPVSSGAPSTYRSSASPGAANDDRNAMIAKRYEIERIHEELTRIFSEQPKVAKHVFTRVLTEEGVETTAEYIDIFGESVVLDMLRDPSLQRDLAELIEFYAKNTFELNEDEKLELLRALHNRTVAAKMIVMGNRSSNLFDFLAEMDGLQILQLVENESLTVKAIVMTQVDPQKQQVIYSNMDDDTRMTILTELSRIDHLPRDYIFNVAGALKRKQSENPRLNTESLPGSDVLVSLLERTGFDVQQNVVQNLENTHPENARSIKSKLVSIDTLRFLRDGQLLEVVLSLRHDELLQFLKGAPESVRRTIYEKAPTDLVEELEEELANVSAQSRETYQVVERKVLNRVKRMASEGVVSLIEVNERMFAAQGGSGRMVEAGPGGTQVSNMAS